MRSEIEIAWVAGLFEGEGTFRISNNKVKGVSISSTDLDILEKVQEMYGGSIYRATTRLEHWKQAYSWTLCGRDAIIFIEEVRPMLGARRGKRALEYLAIYKERISRKLEKDWKILELFEKGLTHQEIAAHLGMKRASITKYLNRRGLKRRS